MRVPSPAAFTSAACPMRKGVPSGIMQPVAMIQVSPHDTDWVARYLESGRVDGFILLTATCTQRNIHALAARKAPFVTWGLPPGPHAYGSVSGDSITGGKLATAHLLGSGRSRIAFLGGPAKQAEVQDRYRGYELALLDAGKEV